MALIPSRSSSAVTSADPPVSRTKRTTSLPASAKAVTSARPMPRLAPVTTETFPDSEKASRTDMWRLLCLLDRPGCSTSGGDGNVSFQDGAVRHCELAPCYQNRRPGQVGLIAGQLNLNSAAGYVDTIDHRQWGVILSMGPCHRCGSDRTSSAR